MGTSTRIEWTDATWNPTWGCNYVSPGCKNCYAALQAVRRDRKGSNYEGVTARTAKGKPVWSGKLVLVPTALELPYKWRQPKRIFVNSMSDLGHPDIPFDYLRKVWKVMVENDHHTFQILTKRPKPFSTAIIKLVEEFGVAKNIWLGVSIENQKYVRRLDELTAPAEVYFVSAEPLLGPIEFSEAQLQKLDWLIVGGEAGPGARPMHPQWAVDVCEKASAAGVAVFFKQHGDWIAWHPKLGPWSTSGTRIWQTTNHPAELRQHQDLEDVVVYKVGKKAAGHLLYGRAYTEFPTSG